MLNVLLSFAQFEREVTGERIRDKIAASKKKGMWMGGNVPLGYELKDHRLVIVPAEAEIVRKIYTSYLRLGCVRKLQGCLDRNGISRPLGVFGSGRNKGGTAFSRGSLYHVLASRTYIGEIAHRGQIHAGLHDPIIDRKLWEQVAAKLAENKLTRCTRYIRPNGSVLASLLFDDQGHRYTPTYTTKKGRRYRYYILRNPLDQRPIKSPHSRLPAHEIEQVVYGKIRDFLGSSEELMNVCQLADHPNLHHVTTAAQTKLAHLSPTLYKESIDFLRAIVKRIVVSANELAIEVNVVRFLDAVTDRKPRPTDPQKSLRNDAVLQISAPIKMKRRGSELRLAIPGNERPQNPSVPALIKAISRA